MQNWKTTAAGVASLLIAVGQALNGISNGDFSGLASAVPAVIAGIGLIFAHDAPSKPAA
jgi:hypothetical protein